MKRWNREPGLHVRGADRCGALTIGTLKFPVLQRVGVLERAVKDQLRVDAAVGGKADVFKKYPKESGGDHVFKPIGFHGYLRLTRAEGLRLQKRGRRKDHEAQVHKEMNSILRVLVSNERTIVVFQPDRGEHSSMYGPPL